MSRRTLGATRDRFRAGRIERIVRLHELPLLIGLIVTWMALWREISWMSFVSGVVVAIAATRLFYLPPVTLAGRFNPWWALVYLGYFFWHVAVASFQVAWLAIRPGPVPRTSIIGVRLHTRSDFILTMVGLTNSLIPGSLVAEVDRANSILYLHVIDTPTQKEIREMRSNVYRIERLLILAVGSKREIEATS